MSGPITRAAETMAAIGVNVDPVGLGNDYASMLKRTSPDASAPYPDAGERFDNLANSISSSPVMAMDVAGFDGLRAVLHRAYDQAARGKGQKRHGGGLPFDRQPMQDLIRMNGLGFATGQIGKKASEALGLPADAAVHELLGVIVYAAGAIMSIEREGKSE